MDEAAEWLNYAMNTKWWDYRYPAVAKKGLHLQASKADNAWYDFNERCISLPPWSLNIFTVIHEVSHAIANDTDHLKKFRQTEIALAGRFMSPEAGKTLKYSFLAFELEI